nr:GTP-binding protein YPTM2-like [Rhipicephalus microplus]
MVIWYDAVIRTGKLPKQNELNCKNVQFFDVCNGIFLHFKWTKDKLEDSAKFAGDRKNDVYVGIDVFARMTEYAGGFETCKAIAQAHKYGLSAAVFAARWCTKLKTEAKLVENQCRWDTAGQERFRSITSAYYRGAQVVILVFDLSLAASLYNTPQWLEETLESTGQGHEPLRFLVGTKKDLVNDGCLDGMEGDATKIARRLDAEYWSVSAKTGENVQQLFFRVAALAFVQCLTRELQERQQSPEKAANNNFVRLRKRKHGKKIKAPKCSGSQKCATK